jgi:hypothetical protein
VNTDTLEKVLERLATSDKATIVIESQPVFARSGARVRNLVPFRFVRPSSSFLLQGTLIVGHVRLCKPAVAAYQEWLNDEMGARAEDARLLMSNGQKFMDTTIAAPPGRAAPGHRRDRR